MVDTIPKESGSTKDRESVLTNISIVPVTILITNCVYFFAGLLVSLKVDREEADNNKK